MLLLHGIHRHRVFRLRFCPCTPLCLLRCPPHRVGVRAFYARLWRWHCVQYSEWLRGRFARQCSALLAARCPPRPSRWRRLAFHSALHRRSACVERAKLESDLAGGAILDPQSEATPRLHQA